MARTKGSSGSIGRKVLGASDRRNVAGGISRWLTDGLRWAILDRRMPHEPTTQVAFRFSDRLLTRIDRHAKRLGKKHPGVEFTRADAVRDLLASALDVVEKAAS